MFNSVWSHSDLIVAAETGSKTNGHHSQLAGQSQNTKRGSIWRCHVTQRGRVFGTFIYLNLHKTLWQRHFIASVREKLIRVHHLRKQSLRWVMYDKVADVCQQLSRRDFSYFSKVLYNITVLMLQFKKSLFKAA